MVIGEALVKVDGTIEYSVSSEHADDFYESLGQSGCVYSMDWRNERRLKSGYQLKPKFDIPRQRDSDEPLVISEGSIEYVSLDTHGMCGSVSVIRKEEDNASR